MSVKSNARILACVALSLVHGYAADAPKRPLNVLVIITDQQRWDAMSCAGNAVLKTPHLDKLAAQGARFTSFYSACPVCVPARTAILTASITAPTSLHSTTRAR